MPTFSYYVLNGADSITDAVGSGLGFYGDGGFGSSVLVGETQGHTYKTDGAGVVQSTETFNVKRTHPASGLIGQTGSGLPLTYIPNAQATINVRFSHASSVRTTNVRFRAFDRHNPNNPPSGVVVYAAELIHPDTAQNNTGSGNATWTAIGGTGTLALVSSPGTSGFRPLGASTVSEHHDHYIALSVEPESIGSKTQLGFMTELEYL